MKLVRYEHPESALANGFDNWFRRMFGDFGRFGNFGGGLAGALNGVTNPADVGLSATSLRTPTTPRSPCPA